MPHTVTDGGRVGGGDVAPQPEVSLPCLPNTSGAGRVSSPSRLRASQIGVARGVDSHEVRSIMRGSLRRNVGVKRTLSLQWYEIFDSVHR